MTLAGTRGTAESATGGNSSRAINTRREAYSTHWPEHALEAEVNGKFLDPGKESAVVGYAALQGCRRIADSYWVPPEDFTDPRWRPIYACILNLHRAGREVNYLTINDEIIRLKWESRLDKEIGPAGWQSWSALCDSSIQFSPLRRYRVLEGYSPSRSRAVGA